MKLAHNSGRLLFSPDALIDVDPYIDRLELKCARLELPQTVRGDVNHIISRILGGGLFDRPRQSTRSLRIASSRWLLGGNVHFYTQPNRNTTVSLKLVLNPTRFLQRHRYPNTIEEQRNIATFPQMSLQPRHDDVSQCRLRAARHITFDQSDNFITDASYPLHSWSERIANYLDCVCATIAEELAEVADEMGQQDISHILEDALWNADWSISQVEYYWEFFVPNAIQKVHSVSSDFRRVLRDAYYREYPVYGEDFVPPREGVERNAPYVRGQLEHNDIYAKLYAKASRVVRFEVSYTRQPIRAISSFQGQRPRAQQQLSNTIRSLNTIAEDASARAITFWQDFWERRRGCEAEQEAETGGLSEFSNLIDHVSSASALSSISMGELLSSLVHAEGGVPFYPRSVQKAEAFRSLKNAGILQALPLRRRNNARPRYTLTPRYRIIVARLRSAFDEPIGRFGSELLRDEDPPPPRRSVRHRQHAPPISANDLDRE